MVDAKLCFINVLCKTFKHFTAFVWCCTVYDAMPWLCILNNLLEVSIVFLLLHFLWTAYSRSILYEELEAGAQSEAKL
jgi:hypothetical protein